MRTDGHVPMASTKANNITGKNFGFLPYFQESVNYGLVGRDFAVEPNLKDRGYYVSHPVFSQDRDLLGVAVVKKLRQLGHNIEAMEELGLGNAHGLSIEYGKGGKLLTFKYIRKPITHFAKSIFA